MGISHRIILIDNVHTEWPLLQCVCDFHCSGGGKTQPQQIPVNLMMLPNENLIHAVCSHSLPPPPSTSLSPLPVVNENEKRKLLC